MDDLPDLDSLFRLPLAEFTAARNALAASLTKSGQKEAAARVRALAKPPVSAWVVNQLYWRERSWFDRLIASGALLRQAQASGFAGQVANLQEPLKAQRAALNELSRRAITFLSQEGHGANPDVLRRVTLDLEGLAAREPLPDGPQPGRLTSDVDAPGFEALAALVPKAAGGSSPSAKGGGTQPSRVLSFIHSRRPAAAVATKSSGAQREEQRKEQEKARAAAAKQAVKLAEKNLMSAQRAAVKSEAAMKDAAARVKEVERARQQAEKELEKAAAAADAARQAARRAASDAADAAQALDDAERALEQARARLSD
ncbi:MAG TPA: hypothetical protein VIY56_19715 [Vicinamibacterales bacterium]